MFAKIKTVFISHKILIAIIALFCIGILIYANSFGNKMFWDDNDGILQNTYVHNFQIGKFFSENLIAGAGLESNYWRPLLLITYAIEWKLWGEWAPGYHMVNTLLHIGNALLIFLLFLRLFKKSFFISFFPALIFLVHPLQTEAVTYVSGRGDLLSFFLMLIGAIAYLSYKENENENKKILYYGAVMFAFVFALLSKDRAVIFPAFLLLIDVWSYIKTKKIPTKEDLKNVALTIFPFFIIAGIFLVLRGTVLNFQNTFNIYNIETYYTTHITARFFTFLQVIPAYLSLSFAPITLFMERSENIHIATSFLKSGVLLGLFSSLIISGYAILRIFRKPEYIFAVALFAIGIFPASGILVPVAGIIFEHYMYIPIIGVALFVGVAIDEIIKKERIHTSIKIVGAIIIVVWIAFLGVRTVMRNAEWRNPIVFYEQTLQHAPTSLRVWNNLGMAYADENRHEKALYAYREAIALDPMNPIPYYNSGNTYEILGDIKKAREYWGGALDRNPNFFQARMKLNK